MSFLIVWIFIITAKKAMVVLTRPGGTISIREGVYAESLAFIVTDSRVPFGLSWQWAHHGESKGLVKITVYLICG